MKKIIFFLISIAFFDISIAQKSYLQKQTIKLINQARTNPKDFLNTYREQIQQYEPKFIRFLENGFTYPEMYWDDAIEDMASQILNKISLSPSYNGKNLFCGFSTSKGSGESKPPVYFVCEMYTQVSSADFTHLGLAFNEDETSYAYLVGRACKKHTAVFSFTNPIDSSMVDFEALNTAGKELYMTEYERRMILEINFVRVYPSVYAKLIAKYMHEKAKSLSGLSEVELVAGKEVIAELEKAQPLRVLLPDECVYKLSKLHGQDCQKRGVIDHSGSDGSDPFQRLTKFCPKMLSIGENLAGVTASNPREPVIALLIDDGISTRGHRYTILAPQWKYVSCFQFVAQRQKQYNLYGWVQSFTR